MENLSIKDNVLIYKRKLKRSETYKFSKSKKFETISVFKKPQLLKGMASYCEDGKHVLFIDYDNVAKWLVINDFNFIQDEFKLPPAYLFTTKENDADEPVGSYHVVCLKKFYASEIIGILSKTNADVNFTNMPIRNKYRNWILRLSPKIRKERPKYVEVIGEEKNLQSKISSAHKDFLKKIYNLDFINYQKEDNFTKIFLQEYEAS